MSPAPLLPRHIVASYPEDQGGQGRETGHDEGMSKDIVKVQHAFNVHSITFIVAFHNWFFLPLFFFLLKLLWALECDTAELTPPATRALVP